MKTTTIDLGLTLAEEAYIRRGCRSCLRGLRVRMRDGHIGEVLASTWSKEGRLLVKVEEDGPYVDAEMATVVGTWRVGCCRPLKTRLREVLAGRGKVRDLA